MSRNAKTLSDSKSLKEGMSPVWNEHISLRQFKLNGRFLTLTILQKMQAADILNAFCVVGRGLERLKAGEVGIAGL